MPRYDEFDDTSEQGAFTRMMSAFDRRGDVRPRKPFLAFAIVGGLILLLAGILWVSYPRGGDDAVEEVPVIQADAGPVKAEPDQQGGMDIPYRESTVFDSMRGQDDRKVENLLPPEEQPVDRNQVFAGLKNGVEDQQTEAAADITESSAEPPAQTAEAAPQPAAPAETPSSSHPQETQAQAEPPAPVTPETLAAAPAPEPAAAPEAPAAATPVVSAAPAAPVVAAEPEAAPAATVEPASGGEAAKQDAQEAASVKSTSGGSHYVQLASIKDRGAAATSWKGLQKKFPSQLSGLEYRVQEANVKGSTYYRVQAGPLSQADARSVCRAIGAGACIVVTR